MDIFDVNDYDFVLSKRTRRRIALALVIGIAFVPSVENWYIGQIERHAQHITQEVRDRLTPEIAVPLPEPTPDRAPRR